MSPREELLDLAKKHEGYGLAAIERGKRDAFDPAAEVAEHADIARLLRMAADAMRDMPPAEQQDYAARMKCAVWQRLDDSPVITDDEEALP